MVWVSVCPHDYKGQQDEQGRYRGRQISARVGKGLIGVPSQREIECYTSRSVRMAIEVSRKKKTHTSPGTGRWPLRSRRASLESARLGVMNSVNLDGRACPSPKVDNIEYFQRFDHEA